MPASRYPSVTGAPSTLSPIQTKRLHQLIQSSVGSGGSARDAGRNTGTYVATSHMSTGTAKTADGSWSTAKSVVIERAGSVESDEEVEGLLDDERVGGSEVVQREPSTTSTGWEYGETPLPSRVLFLRHPHVNKVPAPLSGPFIQLDPWALATKSREALEDAFWRMIMPSLNGLMDLGVSSLAAISAQGEKTTDDNRTSREPREHLYAQETIYTLQLPQQPAWKEEGEVDLGPTLRPVYVKKRSAIPNWEKESKELDMGMGWNRQMRASGMMM